MPTPVAPDSVTQTVCDRVRELRKKKGWTLEQLAGLSGVSRSMLSQIERGAANPTLAVAFRIAEAFDLTLGDFVATQATPERIDVIPADDPKYVFRDDGECRIRTLFPLRLEKDVEFYEVRLAAGAVLTSEPHYEGTREFLTIQRGQVRVSSADELRELKPGDSAHYPADVPHQIENIGRGEAVMFLVDIYDRSGPR